MNFENLDSFSPIPKIVQIEKYEDERGIYIPFIQFGALTSLSLPIPEIRQVNVIKSKKQALRGFHGSDQRYGHWKIVTCIFGRVQDAVLDIRPKSKTFGEAMKVEISESDSVSLIIPAGFAHAVEGLSDESTIIYASNLQYEITKKIEFEIDVLDNQWRKFWSNNPILSERDKKAISFNDFRKRMKK